MNGPRGAIARCALILLAAAPAAFAGPNAVAAETTSRSIDRTIMCRVGYFHGARLVYLTARSAVRHGDKLDWLAQAYVSTAGNPLSARNSRPTLAGVTAGWPPPPPLTTGGIGYENARCGPSRANVPLTTEDLTGGVASPFGEDLQCIVAKAVLVRVRATFRTPVAEEPNKAGTYISALGRVVKGQIVVRSVAGRPIAYADVVESGRARLFTSGCTG